MTFITISKPNARDFVLGTQKKREIDQTPINLTRVNVRNFVAEAVAKLSNSDSNLPVGMVDRAMRVGRDAAETKIREYLPADWNGDPKTLPNARNFMVIAAQAGAKAAEAAIMELVHKERKDPQQELPIQGVTAPGIALAALLAGAGARIITPTSSDGHFIVAAIGLTDEAISSPIRLKAATGQGMAATGRTALEAVAAYAELNHIELPPELQQQKPAGDA